MILIKHGVTFRSISRTPPIRRSTVILVVVRGIWIWTRTEINRKKSLLLRKQILNSATRDVDIGRNDNPSTTLKQWVEAALTNALMFAS